jgi:hypothetical protein
MLVCVRQEGPVMGIRVRLNCFTARMLMQTVLFLSDTCIATIFTPQQLLLTTGSCDCPSTRASDAAHVLLLCHNIEVMT